VREGDALLGTDGGGVATRGRDGGRVARRGADVGGVGRREGGRRRGCSARGGRRRRRSARVRRRRGCSSRVQRPTVLLPSTTIHVEKYCLVRCGRWMVFERLKTFDCMSYRTSSSCTRSQSLGPVRNTRVDYMNDTNKESLLVLNGSY
jgi:hypothetical protein